MHAIYFKYTVSNDIAYKIEELNLKKNYKLFFQIIYSSNGLSGQTNWDDAFGMRIFIKINDIKNN